MSDISKQVNDYVAKRQEFKQLETTVFEQIRYALAQEVPTLNSKLPSGYSIGDYDVWIANSSDKPTLSLNLPNKEKGDITQEEIDKLNDMLSEEFERIKKQYGIEVHRFQLSLCA